jgi:mannose-6-phosphate isomerase-like protein (cupin superfamily)
LSKFPVLKMARGMNSVFRPLEITDIDDQYHAFVVRYSGDYIPHTHDKDEFVYILEGSLIMEIDGQDIEVKQGEAIKIPAGKNHRPRCKNMALGMVIETRGLQKQMESED